MYHSNDNNDGTVTYPGKNPRMVSRTSIQKSLSQVPFSCSKPRHVSCKVHESKESTASKPSTAFLLHIVLLCENLDDAACSNASEVDRKLEPQEARRDDAKLCEAPRWLPFIFISAKKGDPRPYQRKPPIQLLY